MTGVIPLYFILDSYFMSFLLLITLTYIAVWYCISSTTRRSKLVVMYSAGRLRCQCFMNDRLVQFVVVAGRGRVWRHGVSLSLSGHDAERPHAPLPPGAAVITGARRPEGDHSCSRWKKRVREREMYWDTVIKPGDRSTDGRDSKMKVIRSFKKNFYAENHNEGVTKRIAFSSWNERMVLFCYIFWHCENCTTFQNENYHRSLFFTRIKKWIIAKKDHVT